MFGNTMVQPDGEKTEWVLDASTKRLINPKYFNSNMTYLYDKSTRPFGLRPDLTNSEQNLFHRKLRMASEFRGLMLSQLHSETLRWRMYHSYTDLHTLRVFAAHPGTPQTVRSDSRLEDRDSRPDARLHHARSRLDGLLHR